MKQVKKIKLKNIIPKEKRLVNTDLALKNDRPILVKKKGRRWWKIIDGNHRFWKYKESNKRKIEVIVQ